MTLSERLASRDADDFRETDVWRCACGAPNVTTRCSSCGKRSPTKVAFADTSYVSGRAADVTFGRAPSTEEQYPWPTFETAQPQVAAASKHMTKTALVAIGIGAATQGVAWLLMRSHAIEPSVAIRFSLLLTIGFYAVVALLVFSRSNGGESGPVWSTGRAWTGALLGGVVGIGVALAVLGLLSAASGHIASDAFASIVVSEGTIGRVIVMGVIAVVCAPLVEEWLFRGMVAESLRGHSKGRALVVSAALFSLWHLRLAAFRYYFLLGLLLGALYLKRGLVASMTAHAAFNGTALAVAVVLAHGAPHTFAADGVSVRAPAPWQRVTSTSGVMQLALRGPSGSEFMVVSEALPGKAVTAGQLAASVRQRGLPMKGVTADVATARVVSLPAGPAVRVDADVHGHSAMILGIPKPGRVWTVVVATGGSPRAAHDASQLLDTLHLD
jgi:membrane protease YdiL (CAAX protease family)